MTAQPFAGLEPALVLDAIERFGVQCSGRLLELNSFENRVYQAELETGGAVVAKFYRPGRWSDATIVEEHQFSRALSEQEIPVIAPIVAGETAGAEAGKTLLAHEGFRVAVYPSVGGYWPELNRAEDRERLGRLIGRMHALAETATFEHRPSMSAEGFGQPARDYLLANDCVGGGVESAYREVSDALLEAIRARFEACGPVRQIRLHGDLHRGNILWTDDEVRIVDLDDCCNGPAIQDLWMLADGDEEEIRRQLFEVIDGYETFREFEWRELGLVEALRGLRLMHHAAWLARRWEDPAFPRAFPWFGTDAYWQEHVQDLRNQLEKLNRPMALH